MARAEARRKALRQRRIVLWSALVIVVVSAGVAAGLSAAGIIDLPWSGNSQSAGAGPSLASKPTADTSSTTTTETATPSSSGTDSPADAPTAPEEDASPDQGAGAPGSLKGFTIAVDAGHQARGDSSPEPIGPGSGETKARVTTGGSGVISGVPESAINLAISLRLRDALESLGATVVMVRTTQDVNISNSERAAIANNAGVDLFIRIHCNGAANQSTHGAMTLVPGPNQWTGPIVEPSRSAAQVMHPIFIEATGAKDLGIIKRTDLSGFNWCTVPSVLFEVGFLSNPDEDRLLNTAEYQQTIADAIAKGTASYLN